MTTPEQWANVILRDIVPYTVNLSARAPLHTFVESTISQAVAEARAEEREAAARIAENHLADRCDGSGCSCHNVIAADIRAGAKEG